MTYRQNTESQHPPLTVHVTRGNLVESAHLIDAIVVDGKGHIVYSAGETAVRNVFPRSAVKLLQAVSLVESGAIEKFNLDSRHIAIASASHGGQKIHTDLVESWLARIKCNAHHLVCAAHAPYHEDTYKLLLRSGQEINATHNNCSGKHAGILSALRAQNMDVLGYENFDHPYQFRLREIISELSGEDIHLSEWGIDGCGIPTYVMSLKAIANGFSQFLPGAEMRNPDLREACKTIREAIFANPEYIGGANDFCTSLIEVSEGKAFVKSGAEGIYAGFLRNEGLAYALKVRDGAARAAKVVVLELLKKFDILNRSQYELMNEQCGLVKNWAGKTVGKIFAPSEN